MADDRQEKNETAQVEPDFVVRSENTLGATVQVYQLELNQVVAERYRVLNEIGRGGMGIVNRVGQSQWQRNRYWCEG